ncbi:uncharacterized protein LOC142534522 [Primulina tabacum]|uniref:uncharacterized protein LOC142534522 n=1 Tax=Primulina tabacum TaxID=48773 RepID=UPI003F5AA887
MAIATIVAATLQGIVNPLANAIQPPPEPQPRGIKYRYESLRRNRVTNLDGNPDPDVSHNWLKNVETQLHLLVVPEELRVEVVIPFSEDRARKWWETVSPPLAEVEQITWQSFRGEFLKQYYPAEFRLQKLSEFENFKQTPNMTVMEYTSRFNDMGTYVPTIMSDETLKMHRFKKGLNSRIRSALAVFKPNNFADLMGAAMSAETDIKCREEENNNKRPMASQSAQNGFKFKRPNYSSGLQEEPLQYWKYRRKVEEADNTNEVLAAFMDLINRVFKPYLDKFVVVFIDDIFIYSPSEEEHKEHLCLTLQTLREMELYAKFKKYEFWLKIVAFLGLIISELGVSVDLKKVEAKRDWPQPKSN